jgi:tellurite resistance protein
MTDLERLELLKAALAVAAADGELCRSEMGVIKGLAARVGVGEASLDAMVAAARRGDSLSVHVAIQRPKAARTALELLVGQARIDGEISPKERALLVWIAARLNIAGPEFDEVYRAGLARADALRKRRKLKSPTKGTGSSRKGND